MEETELRNRFGFHSKSRQDNALQHRNARVICFEAALGLNALFPDGREKALVMTHLEEALMWANKGIALQDGEPDDFG
jgi:hypothetical protein